MQQWTRKNSITATLVLLPVLLSSHCFAEEKAQPNSNLTNFIYPNHNCKTKPLKPKKPGKLSTHKDIEIYNREISKYNINVANYNKEIKIYKSCINQYIKNGNHDINTIRQRLNKALKKARSKNNK